ncbi:MAG: oxygenase MpaB family protein [Ilumatobacteraceae bacterium]
MSASIGASRFTWSFLDELRLHGDPEADEAVGTFLDSELETPATDLMTRMIAAAPGSDESSRALGEFVDKRPPLPAWAEPELIEHGQDLFAQYVPQFGLALWMASIPAGYAGAKDALVLERTAQLVSHPKRRFLETGQFVLDVMTKGGLDDAGSGAADIRHVRLMHAAVRHMLRHEDHGHSLSGWDPTFGVPLNQEALLATQFTFSIVGLRSLQRFGIHLSDLDKEAYTHLWSVIGHLMGVRDDLLPLDFADSSTVWDRITAKEYGSSPGGTLLTRHAIEVMRQLIPGRWLDGLPASGIRFLLGNETADLLEVPPANWTRVLFVPGRALGGIMNRFELDSIAGVAIIRTLGRTAFREFLVAERHPAGRPGFEVPEEMQRVLGMT